MLRGFTRKFKPLEILTEEEVQAIHRGTLDVPETTGVRIEPDRALKLMADPNSLKVFQRDLSASQNQLNKIERIGQNIEKLV